ncbi:MAG: YafY family transcriptional regulator [Salinivirgaceae bacterium]|nr:YafY family transcriptional regulator [Salinivirgaceae bacterium]
MSCYNRIDRLQAILIHIQSKKIVKAQEIADRFEISLRTVYRDIRALEEGGVPIGAEAGIGYFLDENYSLPPVMFTPEEASALLMAGKLIPHMSDKKVNKAFQEALFKIKSVMKSEDKDMLEKLENSVRVYSGLTEAPKKDSIFLQDIQNALVKSKVIEVEYFAHYNQTFSKRMVEPIGLIFYAMNWHLIGFCRLRNNYRDFRLDRIKNLTLSNETYNKKLDKEFENYLKQQQEANEYFEITLNISHDLAHNIHESKYWYGFISEEKCEDTVTMKFLNPDLHGFARWIITMLDKVEVVAPNELRTMVFEMVTKLCSKYK